MSKRKRPLVDVDDDGFVRSEGVTVGNVFLNSVSYEHTIEGWVKEYFPDAHYVMNYEPRITKIPTIEQGGMLAIQGQKGFGKSVAIRMLKETTFKDLRIVHINFSRSLSFFSAKKRGLDTHHYTKDSKPLGQDRLEVVINSLPRIKRPYDVVVIDEVVSVMEMICGSLITDTHRMAVIAKLFQLLRAAKYVVIADAMLGPVTVHFFRILRGLRVPLRFVDYTYRPQHGCRCIVYREEESWVRTLCDTIEEGKRVVVATMLAYMARRLAALVRMKFKDKRVQVYFEGRGSDDTAGAMKNIKRWTNCDVLIYSPVITAGCSFEEKHFDELFFFGMSSPYTGSVRSAIQMTSRVRDLANKTIHSYIKTDWYGKMPLPTDEWTPPRCTGNVLSILDAASHCVNTFQQKSAYEKLNNFAYDFIQHKVNAGFTIEFASNGEERCDIDFIKRYDIIEPSTPAIEEPFEENNLWRHINMCDVEEGSQVAPLYSVIEKISKESTEFRDFTVRRQDVLRLWCSLMIKRFIFLFHGHNKDTPFFSISEWKYEADQVEEEVVDAYKLYKNADVLSKFNQRLTNAVWKISCAMLSIREGRKVLIKDIVGKFPLPSRKVMSMIRENGSTLLHDYLKKDDEIIYQVNATESIRSFSLYPDMIVHRGDDYVLVHFVQEYDKTGIKYDFLKLYFQAAFLEGSDVTELMCVHMFSCSIWTVPFDHSQKECMVNILNEQKRQSRLASLHTIVDISFLYDMGEVDAVFDWYTFDDELILKNSLKANTRKGFLKLFERAREEGACLIGFNIWDALHEAFCDDETIVDKLYRIYDIGFMIQSVVGDETRKAIRSKRHVMGFGVYKNISNSFAHAFVDIRLSRGFTYWFDNDTIISKKCGDILNIGDCVTMFPID